MLLGLLLGGVLSPVVLNSPAPGGFTAIEKRGVLRVLVARVAPPALFGTDAMHPGFDREILEGFAALWHLRIEQVLVDAWKDLIPALQAGQGDVIAGGFSDTAQRRTLIAFTRPVFPTQVVVVNLAPQPVITEAQVLRKTMLAAARDSSQFELARASGVPVSRIVDLAGNIDMDLEALRAGRVAAVLADLPSALLAQQRDANVQIGMPLGKPSSLAFGVRRDDVRLREELDRHIDNLRRSGAWSRLVVTYWGARALAVVEGRNLAR